MFLFAELNAGSKLIGVFVLAITSLLFLYERPGVARLFNLVSGVLAFSYFCTSGGML